MKARQSGMRSEEMGALYQRKVVGTLRVPFLIMPDTIQITLIRIEIQRHTECAYYFKRHRPFCLVINEPEASATDKSCNRENAEDLSQRKVVGTLRVPFLIMPDTIQITPIRIEIQRNTECAYYFGPPPMR